MICAARAAPDFFPAWRRRFANCSTFFRPLARCFGRKDLQQLRVVQAMTAQLDFEVEIIECETARAADGLAESSRNNYLSPAERKNAPQLFASLRAAAAALRALDCPAADKTPRARAICEDAKTRLRAAGFVVDYFELRDSQTLALPPADGGWRAPQMSLLAAAALGQTRLIDNLSLAESP